MIGAGGSSEGKSEVEGVSAGIVGGVSSGKRPGTGSIEEIGDLGT